MRGNTQTETGFLFKSTLWVNERGPGSTSNPLVTSVVKQSFSATVTGVTVKLIQILL